MYYLFLGNNPQLSRAELQALGISFTPLNDSIVKSRLSSIQLNQSIPKTGGVVKVAKFIQFTTPDNLLTDLSHIFSLNSQKNIALSSYVHLTFPKNNFHIIKQQASHPLRWISLSLHPSPFIVEKEHAYELNILQDSHNLILAETVFLTPSSLWIKLDRLRPYQINKRGLLPPKIARLMINLATQGQNMFVADPFCGTGTIPQQALFLGHRVFASDIIYDNVEGTRQNLLWLSRLYNLPPNFQTVQIDAVHLSQHLHSVDAIVTEPHMGPLLRQQDSRIVLGRHTSLTLLKLKNILKGLSKLYLGCLKDWYKIIPPYRRIVMILPTFSLFNRQFTPLSFDTCEKLGYNILSSFTYNKPDALVIRNIVILQKKHHS